MSEIDIKYLSQDQLEQLNQEQKAIFHLLSEEEQQFFAQTFSAQDLPKALDRKGEILKRNQTQRERLAAIKERLVKTDEAFPQPTADFSTALGIGGLAAGAAAVLGIGTAAQTIATGGTAQWKGVSPRLVANALEHTFDSETTDAEVEGQENELTVTIYLKPPEDRTYIPALSVLLVQVQDTLQVNVSNLTSESVTAAIKRGSKKFLDVAIKGFFLWQRRHSIFTNELTDFAQSALTSAFDAAQVVKDLDLEDRVWEVIKQTADAREKVYLVEAERKRLALQDLEKAWDDYYRCPRCGEPLRENMDYCLVCGRARNVRPSQPDPRQNPA